MESPPRSTEQEAAANEDMVLDTAGELTVDTLLGLQFSEDDVSIAIHAAAEVTSEAASEQDATQAETLLAGELERLRAEIAAEVVESSSLDIGLSVTGTADVEDANNGLLDVIGLDTHAPHLPRVLAPKNAPKRRLKPWLSLKPPCAQTPVCKHSLTPTLATKAPPQGLKSCF